MKTNIRTEFESLEVMEVRDPRVSAPGRRSGAFSQPMQRKKIWIDIDNSPHVPFFLPIIEELQKKGFEVFLTARDMYQVRELLDFFNLRCKVIGGHWGKNKILKVLVNVVRVLQLIPTAAKARPDLAVSHGSRAQVLACKLLNIPTIMMHDYEHSIKTGFLEADWTFMPDVIPNGAMSKNQERTLKYPGLKEDVYVPRFRPDPGLRSRLGIAANELLVTVRPPATEAHYHNPESEGLLTAVLENFSTIPEARVLLLPRNKRQESELRAAWGENIASGKIVIPDHVEDGLNIVWNSDLVVSGGGTMNREAAAMGVPVYSIFRGQIGAVDRYLAIQNRMVMLKTVEDVKTKIQAVRRDKYAHSLDTKNSAALETIIQHITSVAELKRPSLRAERS